MKENPAETLIRQRMAAGILSNDGFLGSDQRTLGDIVAQDCDELQAAGISLGDLAGLLEQLQAAAEAGLETAVSLCGGKITVELIEVMGHIPCPFGCGQNACKGVITVTTPDKTLRLAPMGIHLIRDHGFFQGKGSPFRLEPAEAIALYRLCRLEP